MWGLEVIDYLNQQAAKKARQRSATPFVPDGPEAVESCTFQHFARSRERKPY